MKRNYGIDIFRIMCCIGVLDYHIMDDVLWYGDFAKPIYFLASFCIPGFFLLSGYLVEEKERLTADYCERKVISVMSKLLGWVVFWTVMHFFRTGEIYEIWAQFTAGAKSGGILPVAWFLFTYCILMIAALPLNKLFHKIPLLFGFITIILMIALSLGVGSEIVSDKTQALWLHLYLGYFMLGMLLNQILNWAKHRLNPYVLGAVFVFISLVALGVFAFNVKNATIYLPPHQYYGKWYYTIWLLAIFCLMSMIEISNYRSQALIKRLAENTVVVYLGHLPILLYVTSIYSLQNTAMGIVFIIIFFVGLELTAEIFRKIPLLRKLV